MSDLLNHGKLPLLMTSLLIVLLYPFATEAGWFGREKDYLAKIGDEKITSEEFREEIRKLHTSNRVGKALSEGSSFEAANYRKYLDELIERKLIVLEAERLGLDESRDFESFYKSTLLNYILPRLRQEEILNKVVVTDEDIEDYYTKERLREQQDRGDADSSGTGNGAEGKTLTTRERGEIRNILLEEKVRKREEEYFNSLKEKAVVEIDEDLLEYLKNTGKVTHDTDHGKNRHFDVLITVNGEPVRGIEFAREWFKVTDKTDEAASAIIERLILYKVLDQEALSRGYKDEEALKERMAEKRDDFLADSFKRKIVAPLVRVDDADITRYYEENRDKYKESDTAELKVITLKEYDEAQDILDEIRGGADFSYLAGELSLDPSKRRGGTIGWITLDLIGKEIKDAVANAKTGDTIGPFKTQAGYSIFRVLAKKEGKYKDLDTVKRDIYMILGKEIYEKKLGEYLSRLRSTVPVDINERELKRIVGQ